MPDTSPCGEIRWGGEAIRQKLSAPLVPAIWEGVPDTVFTAAQQTALENAAEKVAAEHAETCDGVRKDVTDIQFLTRPKGKGPHSLIQVYVRVRYRLCLEPKLPN